MTPVRDGKNGCWCCGSRFLTEDGWCDSCRERGHHEKPELVHYTRGYRDGYDRGRAEESAARPPGLQVPPTGPPPEDEGGHLMREGIEPGHCAACGAGAERNSSGGWWHTTRRASCGRRDAAFQALREQTTAPRNRQIEHPGRDR